MGFNRRSKSTFAPGDRFHFNGLDGFGDEATESEDDRVITVESISPNGMLNIEVTDGIQTDRGQVSYLVAEQMLSHNIWGAIETSST